MTTGVPVQLVHHPTTWFALAQRLLAQAHVLPASMREARAAAAHASGDGRADPHSARASQESRNAVRQAGEQRRGIRQSTPDPAKPSSFSLAGLSR